MYVNYLSILLILGFFSHLSYSKNNESQIEDSQTEAGSSACDIECQNKKLNLRIQKLEQLVKALQEQINQSDKKKTGEFVSVCDRTPQVRDEIMRQLTAGGGWRRRGIRRMKTVRKCSEVTPKDLEKITRLDFSPLNFYKFTPIFELKKGDFSGLVNVEDIDFSFARFRSLEAETGIYDIKKLKTFRISNSSLTYLAPEAGRWTNLETFIAFDARLENLPPEIGNWVNIKYVDVSRNGTLDISSFCNLPNLKVIYVDAMKVKTDSDCNGKLGLKVKVLPK